MQVCEKHWIWRQTQTGGRDFSVEKWPMSMSFTGTSGRSRQPGRLEESAGMVLSLTAEKRWMTGMTPRSRRSRTCLTSCNCCPASCHPAASQQCSYGCRTGIDRQEEMRGWWWIFLSEQMTRTSAIPCGLSWRCSSGRWRGMGWNPSCYPEASGTGCWGCGRRSLQCWWMAAVPPLLPQDWLARRWCWCCRSGTFVHLVNSNNNKSVQLWWWSLSSNNSSERTVQTTISPVISTWIYCCKTSMQTWVNHQKALE